MMKSPMNVFVTGGAGYIGSFATQKLLDEGHRVTVLDNLTTGFRESIPASAQFIQGDVLNAKLLDEIFSANRVDAVMHFAAKTVVPDSIKFPMDYYNNNFVGSLTVLKSAMNAKIKKFIFSSTAAVYAPSESGFVSEESPTEPVTPYGTSKLFFENTLKEVRKSDGLDFIALRYFNVAGAAIDSSNGQRTKGATHLIKVVAELASQKRKSIDVFGTNFKTSTLR